MIFVVPRGGKQSVTSTEKYWNKAAKYYVRETVYTELFGTLRSMWLKVLCPLYLRRS